MEEIDRYINKIIKGDCIENLKKIPDESIDLIFADPPYFMQTEGELLRTDCTKFQGVEDEWDKFENYKQYDEFCTQWIKECKRVMKKNASIWVIGSFQNIYRLGYIMQNMGFWILNDIIWAKNNPIPNFSGTRFQNAHETMIWCTKNSRAKYTFNYKTMKYLNNNKQERSIWNIALCTGSERLKGKDGKKIHSTQKPEKLLYNIIVSSSKPGDIVLDPFFGTGTTGAIAKMTGRNYIGLEREEEYINAAQERINKIEVIHDDVTDLKPGQEIYNKSRQKIGIIESNGYINDGEDTLSIHKMSAKYLGLTNNNGWDYFWVESNNRFIELDALRYEFQNNENIL